MIKIDDYEVEDLGWMSALILLAAFVAAALLLLPAACVQESGKKAGQEAWPESGPVGWRSEDGSGCIPVLEYEIVNVYPHRSQAFTQGLVYKDGYLYEGTGLYGSSSLSRLDLQTGAVLQQIQLDSGLFGEGVALWDDRIIQLTWQSGLGLIYGKDNFTKIGSFRYCTEGWGLTADNESLIMSDGTNILHILDPESYAEKGRINVTSGGRPLQLLNELEYINGTIYANIWKTDRIAIISRQSGQVQGMIDLQGILQKQNVSIEAVDVLNGIAYNAENHTILVTGKLWPKLFEIRLRKK
jgi:glutamine cyclotransferase